jgi:hypothetical protein
MIFFYELNVCLLILCIQCIGGMVNPDQTYDTKIKKILNKTFLKNYRKVTKV